MYHVMDWGQLRDKMHFALLPAILKQDVEQPHLTPTRDEETEREEEEFLRTRGIAVIRYRADDPFHSHLVRIVRDLRERTGPPLPGRPKHKSLSSRGVNNPIGGRLLRQSECP